jgi:hypothetical protein
MLSGVWTFPYDSGHGREENLQHQRPPKANQGRICIRVSSCGRIDIWEQHPDDSKKRRINGEKVFEIAKSMGSDPSVLWAQESEPLIEAHPW